MLFLMYGNKCLNVYMLFLMCVNKHFNVYVLFLMCGNMHLQGCCHKMSLSLPPTSFSSVSRVSARTAGSQNVPNEEI